ncbi:MAG TPA: hypothetical protein VF624_14635 [Tepidisphaeraceae bacterium]|jgi:hypothetical protein
MRTTLRAILLLFACGGWLLAAAALHVVRYADDRIGIVPKNRLGVTDTYVDTRAWTPGDNEQHADFVARLTESEKTHWLVPATQPEIPGPTPAKEPAARPPARAPQKPPSR